MKNLKTYKAKIVSFSNFDTSYYGNMRLKIALITQKGERLSAYTKHNCMYAYAIDNGAYTGEYYEFTLGSHYGKLTIYSIN